MSLIAAGSLALLVVSAVIAFNGWPETSTDSPAPRTTALAAAGEQPGDDRLAKPIVLADAPRPRPRRVATAAPVAPVAERVIGRKDDRSAVHPQSATSVGGTLGEDPSPAPQVDEPEPTVGDPVREATESIGDATSETTDSLGESVQQVSPELGRSVDEIGQLVDETLTGLGDTVGRIIDPLGGQ
jgi:hypothetical protein